MKIALLAADDPAVARVWREVEAGHPDPPLACGWDWTDTWLRHFGDLVRARVAVGRDGDGATRGVALLAQPAPSGPFRVRELCVGTAGPPPPDDVYVEYNALLAEAGQERGFASALARALAGVRGWDVLRLDGFDATAVEGTDLVGPAAQVRAEPSPFADLRALGGEGGAVIDGLSRNARQQIRRSMKGFGELECEWAGTPERAAAIFAELVELHQRRWVAAGQPGAFASARVTGFHRDLIDRLGPQRAALFRVSAAGATVGCLYSLVDRGRLLFYQGGLARYEDNRLKPGLVAHVLFMQQALERGYGEYDFLAGDSDYKRRLSTGTRELVWATVARRAPRPLALAAARRVRGLVSRTARRPA